MELLQLNRNTLATLVLIMNLLMCAVLRPTNAADNDSNDEEDDEMMAERLTRRSEVSRALGLLKKHLIVGKDAKIVLKPSGKHLLVDPSDKLQIVHDNNRKSSSLVSSSKSKQTDKLVTSSSNKNSKKSSKLNGKSSKSTTRKRSSNNGGRTNKASPSDDSSSMRISKRKMSSSSSSFSSSSSSSSISKPSVRLIQKSIMNGAASKSAVIVDSLMATQMLEEMTRLVTSIVRNKRASSLSDLSDLITETLDERYGPHWHTISVASQRKLNRKSTRKSNANEIIVDHEFAFDGDKSHFLNMMTHIAIDDHRKSAIFYATFDFGNTLRIFVFK